MTRTTLTEEKRELYFKLLDIIAELERVRGYQVNIKDIIPISKGLKVVYTIATDKVRQWSRTIKYSDLANENWDIPNAKGYRGETWIGLEDEIEDLNPWFIII